MSRQLVFRPIAMVAALVSAAVCAAEPVERNFSTSATPSITIYNKKGSLDIVGWDENKIQVTGTMGGSATHLDVDEDPEEPEITVVTPKLSMTGGEAHLTIRVPRAASLEIETVSAPITIGGVSGESTEVRSVSGTIRLDGPSGDVQIEGVSGSVTIVGASGDLSITNVSGKIDAEGTVESLEIESVSGGIDVRGRARSISSETVSGSTRIAVEDAREVYAESISGILHFLGSLAEEGELELQVLSAGIDVEFTQPAYGEYEISTFSGTIDCGLEPLTDLERDGKHMEFEFGQGERSIDLESFSGSINVR